MGLISFEGWFWVFVSGGVVRYLAQYQLLDELHVEENLSLLLLRPQKRVFRPDFLLSNRLHQLGVFPIFEAVIGDIQRRERLIREFCEDDALHRDVCRVSRVLMGVNRGLTLAICSSFSSLETF